MPLYKKVIVLAAMWAVCAVAAFGLHFLVRFVLSLHFATPVLLAMGSGILCFSILPLVFRFNSLAWIGTAVIGLSIDEAGMAALSGKYPWTGEAISSFCVAHLTLVAIFVIAGVKWSIQAPTSRTSYLDAALERITDAREQ